MAHLIDKDTLVAEIEKRFDEYSSNILRHYDACTEARVSELRKILVILNTLEVKEVNEVPATVMVNKYGNRFVSSWSGLKEYDDLKEGEEIKILIPKK